MESIHLIPQDLRRGEMIIQVADLLTSLEKSAQDIFSRVDSRVKELSRELKDIDQRVEVAKSQVDSLKQFKNRGVRIYSTGKYPSKHEIGVQDYQPIARNPVDQGRQEDAEKKTVRGIHIPFSEEVVLEKLQFYQYRGKGRINPLQQQTSQEDQVPSVPWERLTHVASLVRFNSSQNPFLSRGKSSSATDQKTRKKHHLDEDEADISQPAPASMSRIDEEDDPDSFFKYNPELNAAPTLIDELPAALPDLDGIASDMFFSADEAPGGSSSMFFAEPVSATNQRQTGFGRPVQNIQEVVDTKKRQDISQRPTTAPVEQKSFSFSSSSEPVKTEPAIAPPPPPPPSEPLVSKLEISQPSSVPLSSGDGGRASLLESIRNAAGKPKKGQVTAKDLKIEKKKKKQEEKAVSGDLMGDLMASLRARRIGISGGNEQPIPRTSTPIPSTSATTSTEPASSALLRVSSMIPPPPPTSAPAGYSDDEDWN